MVAKIEIEAQQLEALKEHVRFSRDRSATMLIDNWITQANQRAAKTYDDDFHMPGKPEWVCDARGTFWLIVRDGGMVQTADYGGTIFSAGIKWLTTYYGPLTPVPDPREAAPEPVYPPTTPGDRALLSSTVLRLNRAGLMSSDMIADCIIELGWRRVEITKPVIHARNFADRFPLCWTGDQVNDYVNEGGKMLDLPVTDDRDDVTCDQCKEMAKR